MRQPSPEKSIGKNDPEGRVVGEIPKKEAPETDNLPEISVVMVPKGTENVTREEVEKGMFNPSGRPGSGDSLEDTAEWPVHKPDEVDPDADTAEHPVPEAPAAPKETPGKAYKAGVFAGSILNRGRQAIDRILNQKEIEALRTRLKGALEDMGGHASGTSREVAPTPESTARKYEKVKKLTKEFAERAGLPPMDMPVPFPREELGKFTKRDAEAKAEIIKIKDELKSKFKDGSWLPTKEELSKHLNWVESNIVWARLRREEELEGELKELEADILDALVDENEEPKNLQSDKQGIQLEDMEEKPKTEEGMLPISKKERLKQITDESVALDKKIHELKAALEEAKNSKDKKRITKELKLTISKSGTLNRERIMLQGGETRKTETPNPSSSEIAGVETEIITETQEPSIDTLEQPAAPTDKAEEAEALEQKKSAIEELRKIIDEAKLVIAKNEERKKAILARLAEIRKEIEDLEKPKEEIFSNDFLKAKMLELLKGSEKISEVKSLEVKGEGEEIVLTAQIKASGFNIGLNIKLNGSTGKIEVKSHEVDANFLAKKKAQTAIEPLIGQVGGLVKNYIEQERKRAVQSIFIKNGELQVVYK